MQKEHVKGAGKQAKGHVRDAVGRMTGNERMQAEGTMDKAEGKAQQKMGDAKDRMRDTLKH